MDRSVKLLLGLIVVSLIAINMQLAGVSITKTASAEINGMDLMSISKSIETAGNAIAGAISGVECKH